MRRLLLLLLATSAFSAFAEDVSLKPFRAYVMQQTRPTYTVVQGDTVYTIARKFGRSPKLLLWLNRIDENAILPIGKVIFIGDAPVVVSGSK